jgi:DNA ligase (NAD+)
MNIDGLGPAILEMLIQEKYVATIEDLYQLEEHKAKLFTQEGFGEKSIEKMLKSIEKSKSNELHQFITGLGISLIGAKAAKVVSNHFGSIDALISATYDELVAIDEIGHKMAESLIEALCSPELLNTVQLLKEKGMQFKVNKKAASGLDGMTFVLTGTLEKYSRKELQVILENNGGKVSSSVSKKTDYVIYGEKAGSKLKKANDLEVKTLDENAAYEFLQTMNINV